MNRLKATNKTRPGPEAVQGAPATSPSGYVAQLFVFEGEDYLGWDCFDQDSVAVGKDKYADLCLEDSRIADTQALFQFRENRVVLIDPTQSGLVRVNDHPIGTCLLGPLDVVTIGRFTVKARLKPIQRPPTQVQPAIQDTKSPAPAAEEEEGKVKAGLLPPEKPLTPPETTGGPGPAATPVLEKNNPPVLSPTPQRQPPLKSRKTAMGAAVAKGQKSKQEPASSQVSTDRQPLKDAETSEILKALEPLNEQRAETSTKAERASMGANVRENPIVEAKQNLSPAPETPPVKETPELEMSPEAAEDSETTEAKECQEDEQAPLASVNPDVRPVPGVLDLEDDEEDDPEDIEASFSLKDKVFADQAGSLPKKSQQSVLEVVRLRNDRVLDVRFLGPQEKYRVKGPRGSRSIAENSGAKGSYVYFDRDRFIGKIVENQACLSGEQLCVEQNRIPFQPQPEDP